MNKAHFVSAKIRYCLLLFLLAAPFTTSSVECQDTETGNDLRVMSFNIRFGSANDGANHWDHRQANVITTIKEYGPDLLGTQEVLAFQASYLRDNLKEYTYVGRSRENRAAGEQCGVLFRTSRFDLLEQGHFWLSETPNVPGSKSWDSSLPRMASWVKLFDRKNEKAIYFINTHFDHRGAEARHEAAKLIVKRTKRFEEGVPVILAGDFNTGPGSKPHAVLDKALQDTFATLHPDQKAQGTGNRFAGKKDGARIDYVFVSGNLKVISAAIDYREFDGKMPSDHYPVNSVVRFSK